MIIRLKKGIYSLYSIKKASFIFTEKAYLLIDEEDDYYIIDISPKDGVIDRVEEDFKNEVLAQTIREDIFERTRETRNLIIGRALSSSAIINNFSMVGAEDTIKDDSFDADTILKDWFNNDKA